MAEPDGEVVVVGDEVVVDGDVVVEGDEVVVGGDVVVVVELVVVEVVEELVVVGDEVVVVPGEVVVVDGWVVVVDGWVVLLEVGGDEVVVPGEVVVELVELVVVGDEVVVERDGDVDVDVDGVGWKLPDGDDVLLLEAVPLLEEPVELEPEDVLVLPVVVVADFEPDELALRRRRVAGRPVVVVVDGFAAEVVVVRFDAFVFDRFAVEPVVRFVVTRVELLVDLALSVLPLFRWLLLVWRLPPRFELVELRRALDVKAVWCELADCELADVDPVLVPAPAERPAPAVGPALVEVATTASRSPLAFTVARRARARAVPARWRSLRWAVVVGAAEVDAAEVDGATVLDGATEVVVA